MRGAKIIAISLLCVCLASACAQAGTVNSSLLRSMLFPGSGQAEQGHYTRAALFAGGGIIGGIGVFISQIQYNRAAERYDSEKANYAALADMVEAGDLVRYQDITSTYAAMRTAYDQADTRYAWRNFFLGTLITAYTLNIVDILMNPGESGGSVSMDVNGDSVRLVKTINF
jgi:hypothetical protein